MLALIGARALQGLGGGGLISLAQTIIADIVAPKERARYQGYFASVFVLASIAGPVLGGFFAEHLHWSMIFWINLPLGAVALWMTWGTLRQLPRHERPHRLDVLGAVLMTLATVLFLLAQDEFVAVIRRETGKPETEALAVEVLAACDALSFYAKRSKRILADRTVPLHLLQDQEAPHLVPAARRGRDHHALERPLRARAEPDRAGADGGQRGAAEAVGGRRRSRASSSRSSSARPACPTACSSACSATARPARALVDAGCDKISFTGSVATGRKVAEACGRQLIPCTLELGGKDPMLVCADADLERAAAGAVYGSFMNAGQVCVSTERVYVVDAVADEFVRRRWSPRRRAPPGRPAARRTSAPMIWPAQLEVVEAHVNDAVGEGRARPRRRPPQPDAPGLFFEPTVLIDVDHDMAMMREETFGPVLPIMRVRDEEEALRLANDSRYGLNANVWTRDKRKGVELAKQIETGSAVVNDCMLTYGLSESPFGGRKESGVGQVNGEIGLRGYCYAQSITVDRFGAKTEFLWFPYTARKTKLLRRMMRLLWGSPLGRLLS